MAYSNPFTILGNAPSPTLSKTFTINKLHSGATPVIPFSALLPAIIPAT